MLVHDQILTESCGRTLVANSMTPFELNLENELAIERQRFANKWLFPWHNINIQNRVVDVDDFRGGRIRIGGVVFEGQSQQIYWRAIDRYSDWIVHDVFGRWDQQTRSYPTRARTSSLAGIERLLLQFVGSTFRNAIETDRRIRGRGFPERVPVYHPRVARARCEIMRLAQSHRALMESNMEILHAFSNRVERRLNEMLAEVKDECRAIAQRMSVKGLGQSGPRIREQLQVIQKQLHRGMDWALNESNRLPGRMDITRGLVLPSLTANLGKFANELYDAIDSSSMPDSVLQAISEHRSSLIETLTAELRDYSQGIWQPRSAGIGTPLMTTTNSVTIHGPNAGSVQVAGANSSQEVTFVMQPTSVGDALKQLVDALEQSSIDQATKSEITVEADTIKLQLHRSKPNLSVIQAAVTGIHQLAIGIGANLLTPHVMSLMAAVGLN